MDAGQMAAMAEATRLTRQGRLVEATALIQQTLAGPAATRRPPEASCAGEGTAGTPGRDPDARPALRAGAGHNWGWPVPAGFPAAALCPAGAPGVSPACTGPHPRS